MLTKPQGETEEEKTPLGEHWCWRMRVALTYPLSHTNENKPDTGLRPEVQTHTDKRLEHHKKAVTH